MLIKPILVALLSIKIYTFFYFLSVCISLSILRELYYILVLEELRHLYSFISYFRARLGSRIIYFLS